MPPPPRPPPPHSGLMLRNSAGMTGPQRSTGTSRSLVPRASNPIQNALTAHPDMAETDAIRQYLRESASMLSNNDKKVLSKALLPPRPMGGRTRKMRARKGKSRRSRR